MRRTRQNWHRSHAQGVVVVANTQRWQDFEEFCSLQLGSGDYDPVYPVLAALERGMPRQQAMWFSMLYIALYNLPSALIAEHQPSVLDTLPTGTERRNLRGGKVGKHMASLVALVAAGNGMGMYDWLQQGFGDSPTLNWNILQERLQQPWGNGRWAAYKTGEILQLVHGLPVEPSDMGHAFSSGPRKGLALFYPDPGGNGPATIQTLNTQSNDLLHRLRAEGLVITMGQAETMLCNFHSLVHGDYYPGHDIDLMQEQADQLAPYPELATRLEAARWEALPTRWLGELGGWHGVDTARKKAYRDHGVLVQR